MIHIMIVEDNEMIGKNLAKIIHQQNINFHVDYASNILQARKLLEGKTVYNLFFLDINLQDELSSDQSGYDLAEEIREYTGYAFTPIVFITSMEEYEITVHRGINYCKFLTKPFSRGKIQQILLPLQVKAEEKPKKNTWVIQTRSVYYTIDLQEVFYVEADGRASLIHFLDGTKLNCKGTLSQCQTELEGRGFLRCHRAFLLNTLYINKVDLMNQTIRINYKENTMKVNVGGRFVDQVRTWINDIRME